MLDCDGFIQTWNTGAERLKGYKPQEIIGRHFSTFYSEADKQAQKPQNELVIALAEGRVEDEGWRYRKDGTRFWANVVITAIYDEDGRHVGFAKVTRDLTERREAEEALRSELVKRRAAEIELLAAQADLEKRVEQRTQDLAEVNAELVQANDELENAGRMKDQFLAVLSHELRTPLTSVYGWVSLLQAGKIEPAKLMHVLAIIERNVKAQTQLVDDLLNVSRIITGNLKLAPQWIDPLTVVNAAVDSIRPAALAKEIRLIVETADLEPMFADPDRLQQVIWNLLTNAVKFTGKGGEIKVVAGRQVSRFQISVSDTGEGISPEFLPHMFERFSQADTSSRRKFGGLGLGLSIVRHIVELHGGNVTAQSEGRGQGTKVIIRIPIPALSPGLSSRPRTEASKTLVGVKVMVVEDEADAREMLGAALESYGASVVLAADAAEAVRQMTQERPDILLSDIGLPNMDGYELLSKIRSEFPEELRNIPAVALSAYANIEHREKSKRAGYLAHVSKPVALPDLVSVLAKVVGR
jgi:PAS domain S-box-containing protein